MNDHHPNVPDQGLPQQYGYHGQQAQGWENQAAPGGFMGGGARYGAAPGEAERVMSGDREVQGGDAVGLRWAERPRK
jgi:hypothetical protein